VTNADLDKCHGHVGPILWEGKPAIMYHYHVNREFPFSVGCFRGSVDYYRALGSNDMRETNLPVYSRSAAAAKLRNVAYELDAAAASAGGGKAAAAAADAGAALTGAAVSLDAAAAVKDPA